MDVQQMRKLKPKLYGSLVLAVGFENAGCGKWEVGRLAG